MRILFVNHYAHVVGGADRHFLTLAQGLRDRGHEVAVLSTASSANEQLPGVFIPLRVTRTSKRSASLVKQADIAVRALWNRDAAAAMRALLHHFRPDVVHAHKLYPQLSVAPLLVAARRGVPVVQTVHDYEHVSANWRDHTGGRIDRHEERLRDRTLNSLTLVIRRTAHRRAVSRWITVSRFVAEVLRLDGIMADVLPNPTERVPESVSSFEDRAGIVFAGSLSPEKGVGDVVEVARRLSRVGVTIAGAGPLEGAVAHAASRLRNLEFVGRLDPDALRELMGAARVVVMPSRWEDPGPLVTLEAMASGTPVIAYPRGGLAEYVHDAGGVIAREDSAALAERCRELHEDAGVWHRHSHDARRAVAERHTVEGYLDRLESVYEAVRRQ